MTAVQPAGQPAAPSASGAPGPVRRAPGAPRAGLAWRGWLARHRRSVLVVLACLVVVGAAMAWNLQGYPGRADDDEGTYVARAWAVLAAHHLANYTYFWDHPFLGWATIAAWAALTDGFSRDLRAVMVGRELMWVVTLVSCALLYVLARRLAMSRFFSAAAVLLFGLSPLSIWYHRMVSLDNLATVWLLAAFAIAASHRRSLSAAVWSAVCLAAATWSKETVALFVPALLWEVGQQSGEHLGRRAARQLRRKYLRVFLIIYAGTVGLYPLLAAIKGELLPGPGHVSMLGEIYYQIAGRQSTGSLLNVRSGTFSQVRIWVGIDPWLTLGGAAALVAAFAVRRYRPAALALLIQVLYMAKGGYVPYAYVTAMLPFAALLIAGVPDAWWRLGEPGRTRRAGLALTRVPVAAAAAVAVAVAAPQWGRSLVAQAKRNGFAAEDAAVAWIARYVPKGDIVVCDDYPWVDIKLRTRATPVYLWTIDDDPAVMGTLLPDGYKDISYLVLDPASSLTYTALPGRPTLRAALRHSVVVTRFGSITIFRVRK